MIPIKEKNITKLSSLLIWAQVKNPSLIKTLGRVS